MPAPPPPGVGAGGMPRLEVRELAVLASLAAIGPLLGWLAAVVSPAAAFNDFNSYWLAGRLVDRGLSPYDLEAMAALGREAGRTFVLGMGYSYPLPFAVAMVPLSRLPFNVALASFLGASIIAFGLTVAAWLAWAARWSDGLDISGTRIRAAALLAGCFPPVIGTIQAGQVNLLVLALLAPGVRWLLDAPTARRSAGSALVALASLIKLVPVVILAPLLLAGRLAEVLAGAATALAVLGLSALIAPAQAGGLEGLAGLLAADPYFTNVSINGFVSRLVLATDRSAAVAPGLFDPAIVSALMTAAFALATIAVLWRAREGLPNFRTMAIAIAFALLAGIVAGPKNSFWNASLTLVSLGLLVAVEAPRLLADERDLRRGQPAQRGRFFDTLDRGLFGLWVLGIGVQTLVWVVPPPPTSLPFAPLVTLAGSAALYGMLGLWWLLARRLVRDHSGPLMVVTLS